VIKIRPGHGPAATNYANPPNKRYIFKNVALLSLEHDNYVSIKTDNFLQLPNLL
jgi:hypothetical protein